MKIKFDFSINRTDLGLIIISLSNTRFSHTEFLQHDLFYISNLSVVETKEGLLIVDLSLLDIFYFLPTTQKVEKRFLVSKLAKEQAMLLISQANGK